MAYKRVVSAPRLPEGDDLTQAMVGIGMNFASSPIEDPNIEDTILAASREGMDHDDLRVLSVLVNWLGIHSHWINADRLIRTVSHQESERVRTFWAAVSQWLHQDRRLARLKRSYRGPAVDLLRVGSAFQIQRRGEDPRFAHTVLRVPSGILRNRPTDVSSVKELARVHSTYRERIRNGPSYRADMWAALVREPSLSAAELARRTYGSFGTAWQVKNDHDLLIS